MGRKPLAVVHAHVAQAGKVPIKRPYLPLSVRKARLAVPQDPR